MIEINLVPPHLRKKTNQADGPLSFINIPKPVLFGLGGIFILLLVLVHTSLIVMWTIKSTRQFGVKLQWQRMIPDKQNIDSMAQELKDLKLKISTINEMTSKKTISWSRKLNTISNLMPKGVWLKRVIWNSSVLTIEGSSYSKSHDEITIVGNFVSSLKKDASFTKDFLSIELNSVNRVKKATTEIADFIITAKVK